MISRQIAQILTLTSLIFLLFFGNAEKTLAQNKTFTPPTPLELVVGHEQLNFQLVVKRRFTPESKFDLLVISVFSENWDKNEKLGNSILIPFQASYRIGQKGFSLAAGGEANSVVGFSPTTGVTHNYISRKILAISVFSYFLNDSQDLKFFGLYEYKPPINETWSVYSRLQMVYNHSLAENAHNRSFLYLRLGLEKGPLGFGIGANWDQFGSERITKNNFGIFTRWEF